MVIILNIKMKENYILYTQGNKKFPFTFFGDTNETRFIFRKRKNPILFKT